MAVTTRPGPGARPLRDVYSVSRLNREARALLEGGFPPVWVEGELSNLSRPASGHIYFSLKDADAQVRCAMFRSRNRHLGFEPKEGMGVLARARVSLYETRGEFQLVVEDLEEAGDGALRRAFEALKQRLAQEGLFDPAHKRPLPVHPRRIGVVTSPTGAALRDILTVLRRRFPAIAVLVYPVPVQGEGAGARIAEMIRKASARAEVDVLIVGRGGGALEDLWAFNEEPVARAIYACALPIVSAVGHEIDFTIADFVADLRAATPSAAAELLSPDGAAWLAQVTRLAARLTVLWRTGLEQRARHVQWLEKRLAQQSPARRLRERSQRLDELEQRLGHARAALFRHKTARLGELRARLVRHEPGQRIRHLQATCNDLARRLRAAIGRGLERRGQHLGHLAHALEAVSPLATLARGYAIVTDARGQVLRRARDVAVGDPVEARLAGGRLSCEVKAIKDEEDSSRST